MGDPLKLSFLLVKYYVNCFVQNYTQKQSIVLEYRENRFLLMTGGNKITDNILKMLGKVSKIKKKCGNTKSLSIPLMMCYFNCLMQKSTEKQSIVQ